jgi:hypothetical protein
MLSEIPESLIYPDSLGATVDAVNLAFFDQVTLPQAVFREAGEWIAGRQGLPGSYAGMFAPTGYDMTFGTATFTGETIRSGAATGHVLSEEACRVLYRLEATISTDGMSSIICQAIDRARQNIFRRMEQSEVKGQWSGVYCCGTCSVALWRHLLASGLTDDLHRLTNGLAELNRHRDGQGRWRRFPFFYTLLALTEIDLPGVRDEILYAEGVIERTLRRLEKADPQCQNENDRRRKIVLRRILEKC